MSNEPSVLRNPSTNKETADSPIPNRPIEPETKEIGAIDPEILRNKQLAALQELLRLGQLMEEKKCDWPPVKVSDSCAYLGKESWSFNAETGECHLNEKPRCGYANNFFSYEHCRSNCPAAN